MKTIILSLACAASLSGQTLAPAFKIEGTDTDRIWIEDASEKSIRFRENPQSLNRIDTPLRSISVLFLTPPEYATAHDLYENRNYEEAQPAFKAAREKYAFTNKVEGNFSTLAGFYEIECARKLGKYEEMETLFSKFQPAPLASDVQKMQLEVNPIYNAIRSEDWPRLSNLTQEWAERKAPGTIRAQLEYGYGMALEGQGKLEDALIAYNKAMVADYASSEVLTRKAALACFGIYSKHPDVELARKLHGTPDESPNSNGASLLAEAASLVQLWNDALGRGEALPDDYKAFLKYKK